MNQPKTIPQYTDLGRIPPQAVHIEQAVLGAIILERDAILEIIDILKPDTFYKEEHKDIFRAALELFNDGKPIDILTLTGHLRKNEKLEYVGGAFYISELTEKVTNSGNIEYHARQLYELWLKREAIRISSELQQNAFDDSSDAFDIIEQCEADLLNINNDLQSQQMQLAKDVLKDTLKELDQIIASRESGQLRGIKTGFVNIDDHLHGLFLQDLTIIAARPGMGKTTFALNIAVKTATTFNTPTAFFSLEMSSKMLMNKIISILSEVDFDRIISGNISDYEMQRIIQHTSELSKTPLYIDETPGISTMELRSKIKRLRAKHGIKLVIVDYLQLMTLTRTKQTTVTNRENEVSQITRQLKGIAKELDISMVVLSQLSRATEARAEKRPQLSDLRESGSIEQDADRVLMIYRQDYYNSESLQKNGLTEIIIAKNRHGSCKTISLQFKGETSQFTSYFESREIRQADF